MNSKSQYYIKVFMLLLISLTLSRVSHSQVIEIDSLAPFLKDSLAVDSVKVKQGVPLVFGIASFYSSSLQGTKTATGEIYRHEKMTGASNHLKLNTWVRVTRVTTGKSIIVRINDRMAPRMAKKGRVIDLSRSAAAKLGFMKNGLTRVKLEVIEPPVGR